MTGPSTDEFLSALLLDLPAPPSVGHSSIRLQGLRTSLACLACRWPAGCSYTGQSLAEIHMTGSPPILQAGLATLLGLGARMAEPGEFTLRAFLSGRLDLTQAESVLTLIDARGPDQLQTALRQLAGGLGNPIRQLRDRILDLLAHLEAGLDFVDEPDVDPLARASLAGELAGHSETIAGLASRLGSRDLSADYPRVVLTGPPNAGKSALFNALAGGDRAIVSTWSGTTRDYLVSPVRIDGCEALLVDTAGIEQSVATIDLMAQQLRRGQYSTADLLLSCHAADHPPPPRKRMINGASCS